jgi:hypothetical protein
MIHRTSGGDKNDAGDEENRGSLLTAAHHALNVTR